MMGSHLRARIRGEAIEESFASKYCYRNRGASEPCRNCMYCVHIACCIDSYVSSKILIFMAMKESIQDTTRGSFC
ncbi:hypothetical protein L6452_39536 [Arctium lappa]|uniref:Uncharacterized protein n=1 Tax=Arctium lappa TaxID=4217 RepID=A0ACB8XRY1_ARCLA|nr:hypothetical protein L6452_39536 [Arctium lappa]